MFVYILYSKPSSRYYVGQTANVTERIERHNQGMVKSTKFGVPWMIVWQLEVSTRSGAMILEMKIKKRGAKRFIDDYNRGVVPPRRDASFGTRRSSRFERDHPKASNKNVCLYFI